MALMHSLGQHQDMIFYLFHFFSFVVFNGRYNLLIVLLA